MPEDETVCYLNNAYSSDSINNNNAIHYVLKKGDQALKTQHQAIKITNLCLSYGKQNVLTGININVPNGVIYSLLGPSGCGKTSLLRCVVGVNKFKEGDIRVFGYKPGETESGIPGNRIGYMPQEIALFSTFTISETLLYFGKLSYMEPKTIKTRTNELINLLDLPKDNKSIQLLSGGQLRRVSLSVALLHSPPLLILDEPTVGLDPMLRNIIWEHFNMITHEFGTTIVITTQYIEEAKSSDIVSFMRDGKILMEKNPKDVLIEMNLSTLESAFLKLCELDSSGTKMIENNVANDIESKEDCTKTNIPNPDYTNRIPAKQSQFATFRRIGCLIWKYSTGHTRNKTMLMANYILPSIQCILHFVSMGPKPSDLPVSIYNADANPLISNMYLSFINNDTFMLKSYNTFDQAIQQVKNGLAWATITFGTNFTRRVQNFAIRGDISELPKIGLHLDATNYAIRNTIQAELFSAYNKTVSYLEDFLNSSETITHNPISIESTLYGNENWELITFVAPGVVVLTLLFSAVSLTALTLILERKDGIFERTLVAGVKKFEIVVSQVITQLIAVMGQVVLTLLTMFYMLKDFQFNITAFAYVTIILLAQSLVGMSCGLFVSAYSKNETQAITFSLFLMMPFLSLSGIFWPIEAIPRFLRVFAEYNPLTKSVDAIRFILTRGWDFSFYQIQLGIIIPIIYFLVFIILSVLGFN